MSVRDFEIAERERRRAAKSLGVFVGLLSASALVCGLLTEQRMQQPADIGIRFKDAQAAVTLRDRNALPEAAIKKTLNEAFDNYRAGKKNNVLVVDLPKQVPPSP